MPRTDSGRIRRMNIIKAIEDEFDESLADIVIVMRRQGCSWETIAGALEISPQTLLTWRRTFGFALPDKSFKVIEKRDDSPVKDELARQSGYRDFDDLYADCRLKRQMLVSEVASMLGVHENTLYKWASENMKQYQYIETEARRNSRDENLSKARAVRGTRMW